VFDCRLPGNRIFSSVRQTDGMPPDNPPQATFRALEQPRSLTVAQRRLLSWLTAGPGSALAAQVAESMVVGECHCGCSSVQLATTAAPLTAVEVGRLSYLGRDDYLSLSSTGRSAAGHRVDVVLHVVDGRLEELELFDTDAGEGTAVDPDDLTALTTPEVT
jgi:hypothetical protein